MVTATLLAATFFFAPGKKLTYTLNATFEGVLPILGGEQGKAQAELVVEVEGLERDSSQRLGAKHEIKQVAISYNDALLPFSTKNIDSFFPKTTIRYDDRGKVLATDAPKAVMPVRLPGLDSKRFPEICYLPIELPGGELSMGRKWSFARTFNELKLDYAAEVRESSDEFAVIYVKLSHDSTRFEDGNGVKVESREGAAFEISEKIAGQGEIRFDLRNNRAQAVDVSFVSTTGKLPLVGQYPAVKIEVLQTTMKVRLKP